jgi:hypothetical protein
MALYHRIYHNICHLVVGYFDFDLAGELLVCGKAELDSSHHGFSRKLENHAATIFLATGTAQEAKGTGKARPNQSCWRNAGRLLPSLHP